MKRFRLLLAALAVIAIAVLGSYSVASAQGEAESKVAGHTEEECIHLLEEGKKIDDCQAAPNQLLPETNEIIWGTFGFVVVFAFIWKVGLPSIKGGMNARTERIRSDLDAAEAQRTEATTILDEYKAQLADARTESARIIEEARQAADEVRSNLQAKAEADITELRAKATADIESAKAQAIADLRGEVAALAIGAAEQVVERSLDQATSVALVEAYIDQVGAKR
jgi:F-type H+-transporting ATPase subunit b